ncbi:hypothetical protein MMC25_001062 [Agyrium rufum]|nr:hypothetical protein [Agyrium rufum]
MFPRFNPTLPLSQQVYRPAAEYVPQTPPRPGFTVGQPYSPSLYSQPGSPQTLSTKDRGSGMGRSQDTLTIISPRLRPMSLVELSTPEELLDLWTITNGQDSPSVLSNYTLSLLCHDLCSDSVSMSLTTQNCHPFYTLHANPLLITRTHPLNPTLSIKITTPILSPPVPKKRTHSQETLAAIFPNLAELTALDQASTIAIEHSLPRSTSSSLEAEALNRAHERETAYLLHDPSSDDYAVYHPTLSNGDPALFPITITKLPQMEMRILLPHHAHTPKPDQDDEEYEDEQTLIRLSLATRSLDIYAERISALPSTYALDTLISSMLCLLLHLHKMDRVLSDAFPYLPNVSATTLTFEPPPTYASRKGASSSSTTLSPRLGKGKEKGGKMLGTWFGQVKDANKGNVQEKVWDPAMAEKGVDLSGFHPYDASDERLSKGTRMSLAVLYWFFELLVWILGAGVGIVAAGIVGLGGLVGGRKIE